MEMHIAIPSGRIYLGGKLVYSLKHKPYIIVDGVKSPLSPDEKRLAKEMTKAFTSLIEKGDNDGDSWSAD